VSSVPTTRDLSLAPADNIRLVELCGPLDEHLHQIEARLGVEYDDVGSGALTEMLEHDRA